MPENNSPQEIVQNVVLVLRNELDPKSVDIPKHLQTTLKQLRSVDKQLKRLTKEWKRYEQRVKGVSRSSDRLARQQTTLSQRVRKSTDNIRKQNRELAQNARQSQRAERSARGFGRTLQSIVAGGTAFFAFRRFQSIAESSINASLLAGPDIGKMISSALPKGIGDRQARQFLARSIQSSLPLQFGSNQETTNALLSILDKTRFLGPELSGQLTSDFLKGFEGESQRLRAFLQSVNTEGVETAIKSFSSQANIVAGSQLVNSLGLAEQKGKGMLDPATEAAIRLSETFQKLNKTIDDVIVGMADKLLPALEAFAELPTSIQALLAGGAVAAPSLLDRGIDIGLGVLAGRGLRGGGKGGILRSLFRGRGGRPPIPRGLPALPHLGPNGFPVISPLRLPAGGAVGVGLAASAAAGSIYTAGRSAQTAVQERKGLAAIQRTQQDRRLFDVAARNKAGAQTELDRIKAKRQQLEAMLLSTPTTGVGDVGFVGRLLGFAPTLPQVDEQQIKRLRSQIAKLKEQENALREQQAEASEPVAKSVGSFMSRVLDNGKEKSKAFAETVKDFAAKTKQATADLEFAKKQAQLIRLQDTKLSASVASSETALRAMDFQIARMHPLGPIAAQKELQLYNKALQDEAARLREVLENIDINTKQGVLQSNAVKLQIKQLSLQERENMRSLIDIMKSATLQEAFQAGRFSKTLITHQENLAIGLRKNIVKPQPIITGSIPPAGQPNKRKPVKVRAQNVAEAFSIAGDLLKRHAPDLAELIDDDEPPVRQSTYARNLPG